MSKKMKLSLNELRVQSFVTSLNEEEKKDVLGGGTYLSGCLYCSEECDTSPVECPDSTTN